MFTITKLLAIAATSLAVSTASAPSAWTVDPSHTRVGFSVRHFFTPIEGRFDDVNVTLAWDRANVAASHVEARIQVPSVNTGNTKRDEHLRTPDWFGGTASNEITFKSMSVRPSGSAQFIATGDLTIKGVTRRVDVPFRLIGVQEIPASMQAMLGGAKRIASFEATLTIDRRTFGVGTGMWAETGVVGSDVDIKIQVEATEK